MSGNEPDLAAPPEALAAIAKGIDLAHAELKELGMIGSATMGRGFSELSLTGLELGHPGLASALETFCERWEWGVRDLTMQGNAFAQGVGLSAGSFAEQDRYVKDTIKIGVNSLNGNPHLSEDEVEQMRWDTIRDQAPWDDADWSGESFGAAHEEVKQNWGNTLYDGLDGQLDRAQDLGLIDEPLREYVDERARQDFAPDQATIDRADESAPGENR